MMNLVTWQRLLQVLILAAFCTCLAPACASAQAQAQPATTPGALVIIGGALRNDNAVVWEKIVQLAGGKGAKIAVFPSAAGSPAQAGQRLANTLNHYGADAFVVPLSVKLKDVDYRQIANDAEWVAKVRAAGGVYFAGGDQGRITQALVAADGSKTPLLQAIWEVYEKGGVIAGSSAGAAIMSSTMFYDAMPVLPTLQLGVTDGKEIAPGLGFIGNDVFIDQHAIIRGRFARMLPVMLKKNVKLGLGIDENSALVVQNRREVEVIGYKGAVMLDLSQAASDKSIKQFNLANVRISYLDQGDRLNLDSKIVTPAASKLAGKIDPKQPYHSAPRFYGDVLGNTAVVDLLQDLIDNSQQQVIGLAFGDETPSANAKNRSGFEFKFTKVAESVGYYSGASGAESTTVLNVRMDVRPVQMAQPLYLP
jgi:cyanophycinase